MTAKNQKALTLFDDYREMMADRIRLDAYAEAIARTVKPGDVVIDLGAGLGILSLLAARAGARKVYALEMGHAASLARRVVRANGLADRIEIVEACSLDVELDVRADVLLSETLGSFALEENTLGFTLDARDRLLAEGGRMIPSRLQPWLAPVDLPEEHARSCFWEDVYGFDFSAAADEQRSRMSLVDVAPHQLLARAQPLSAIDLRTVASSEVASRHLFPIERAGRAHGLAGWFVAELAAGVRIDTAPGRPRTHWRQAFFPFLEPISLVAGDVMEVALDVRPFSARSDDSRVTYEVRCTQLANEAR